MNSQVYSVPGQTEGRKKAFLNWKSIDLSSKLSLTCEGNINFYKSFYHPLPTHENREHPGNFQNKSTSSPFSWVPMERKIFFRRCKKWDHIMILLPRVLGCHKRWKNLSFSEIWNNPTSPLFFIRCALQVMEFYDKFVDSFQDLSKVKNPAVSKAKV